MHIHGQEKGQLEALDAQLEERRFGGKRTQLEER